MSVVPFLVHFAVNIVLNKVLLVSIKLFHEKFKNDEMLKFFRLLIPSSLLKRTDTCLKRNMPKYKKGYTIFIAKAQKTIL